MLGRTARTAILLAITLGTAIAQDPWVVHDGSEGRKDGRHIVLLAGDEEYRSEEALPMLAEILARHHGFRCTVLFSIDPETGCIDPTNASHVPGLSLLAEADLVVMFWRFRQLPDADMKHVVDYVESGKPILGIRTSTHAFRYRRDSASPHARYSFDSKVWPGGFGRQVLGETWAGHHGEHGSQSTRGVIETEQRTHPILRGVTDIWGPSDVYAIRELPADARVLVRGQVLQGMSASDAPLAGEKNDPMMPLIWIRERELGGARQRVLCSTIGAAVDLRSEGLRRLLVNGCYWCLGLETEIPAESAVGPLGDYRPSDFGFGKFRPGVQPADLRRMRSP